MSKMSELDVCVGELRNVAQALTAVAEGLTVLFTARSDMATETLSAPKAEPPKVKPPVTLEQVRAVLADKSRNGLTAEVRALLEIHGATKLSEIDPQEYPALLTEAENLGLTEGIGNG